MSIPENKPLSAFTNRYVFVDSVTLTGHFDAVSVVPRTLVVDCNFELLSDNFSVDRIDSMFEGCSNAVFSNTLKIGGGTVSSAASAFKDCVMAKLPSVDIVDSGIVDARSMFENCYSAELDGVEIPPTAVKFSRMFKRVKSAFFNDISSIPEGDGDYTEIFSGCENGVFNHLHFDGSHRIAYACDSMFYYCGSMNPSNLGFENISPTTVSASNMFRSAGSDGSSAMDDSVFSFSSLTDCDSMFTASNFSFENSFFRFDGYGEIYGDVHSSATVSSLHGVFSGCRFCRGRSPVVVLGHSNSGDMLPSSVDSLLDGRLYGHYGLSTYGSIVDFSSLYEGSSFTTLDLRGIANNGTLNTNNMGAVQDFGAMCRGCGSLKEIVGYIPPNGLSYSSMFEGCSSLSADLASLFRMQTSDWSRMEQLETAFDGDSAMRPYHMRDAASMFKDCAYIYSTSDKVDLVGLFKRIKENLGGEHSSAVAAVRDMLPPMRVAARNQIPGISGVRYDMVDISRRTGTVRFNSFNDELFETEGGDISEFGLYSDYAKSAFRRGYLRYGGVFTGSDSDRCFFLLYYPKVDDVTGDVVGFERRKADKSVWLTPHGWTERFATDSDLPTWNEFAFDALYAGIVCDLSGKFVKYAYIGNYTRICHERRGGFDVTTNYDMPASYFDGLENTIVPL